MLHLLVPALLALVVQIQGLVAPPPADAHVAWTAELAQDVASSPALPGEEPSPSKDPEESEPEPDPREGRPDALPPAAPSLPTLAQGSRLDRLAPRAPVPAAVSFRAASWVVGGSVLPEGPPRG